jgi:hypothetical protein
MSRLLIFDPWAWLAENAESEHGPAKVANPAKEGQRPKCETLAALAGLAAPCPQIAALDPIPESGQGAANPANPAKATTGLAELAALAAPCPQIKDSPALPEPGADASDGSWQRYFNSQIRLLNEDLALEGTTLDKEQRKFSPTKPRKSADAQRVERWCRHYLVEFRPGPDTPDQPCACGERVFWRPLRGQPWRCRSCTPPSSKLQVQWFVVRRPR